MFGIKDNYPVFDENSLREAILPPLNNILVTGSSKFKYYPKCVALISRILTTTDDLKVSRPFGTVGLWDCFSKKKKEVLSDFLYDEVRSFKISAAHYLSQDEKSMIDSKKGFIHGMSDNFDSHVSS